MGLNYVDMYIKFLQEFGVKEEFVANYSPWFSPYVNDTRMGILVHMKNGSQIIFIP